METFWMVYVDGQRGSTIKHLHWVEAEKEAERLALLRDNLNKNVYVLMSVVCFYITHEPVIQPVMHKKVLLDEGWITEV